MSMTLNQVNKNHGNINNAVSCGCCGGHPKACLCDRTRICDGCNHCINHCKCRQVVDGIGPNAETTVNAQGGKQSALLFRSDLFPPRAIIAVGKVLTSGAEKYGKDNWRQIPRTDHVNHALAHVFAWFAGDTQDDHLEHAACRLLMALETTDEVQNQRAS